VFSSPEDTSFSSMIAFVKAVFASLCFLCFFGLD
jgi:hypothetical protein